MQLFYYQSYSSFYNTQTNSQILNYQPVSKYAVKYLKRLSSALLGHTNSLLRMFKSQIKYSACICLHIEESEIFISHKGTMHISSSHFT